MKEIAKLVLLYFYNLLPWTGKEIIKNECFRELSPTVWEQVQLRKVIDHFSIDCIFDVGANEGQYAQMLRDKVNYKGIIISFEPIPSAADKIRKLSKNDPLWLVDECALSDTVGTQEFNIMSSSQFSSLRTPSHDGTELFKNHNRIERKVTVKTKTLDAAYDEFQKSLNFNRPFLKMDTQGFDAEVVKSGKGSLCKFWGLQSELAIKKLYNDSLDFREAITLYEKLGFTLSSFVPNNEGHFPILIETDCIMIRTDLV
jgi:FkbM family methyltransferase